MKKIALIALMLSAIPALAVGRIQNEDVKSLAEIQSSVLTTTGNLTSGNACIVSPASTTGLAVGLFVYDSTLGTRISSGTTIAGLPGTCSAGQIQMSAVAAGSGTGDTITFGGQKSQLINDTKVYVSANSINDTLFNAITNGQIGGGGGGGASGSLETYVSIPYVAAPGSVTIGNRSKVVDQTADLSVKFGIDRVNIGPLLPLPGEYSTAFTGKPVFGMQGDFNNDIRFVGNWKWSESCRVSTSQTGTFKPCIQAWNQNDYVEIVFYGTGIDAILSTELSGGGPANWDVLVAIDGGAETTVLNPSFTYPAVDTANGNYVNRHRNAPYNLAKGLTLGYHVAKIRNNAVSTQFGIRFDGWQVINAGTNLQIASGVTVGGTSQTTASSSTLSYNSGFTTGTLGTTGGRVAVYQNNTGIVASAVNPVAASKTVYPTATVATHVTNNEEVVRHLNYLPLIGRSAGSSNDFSSMTGTYSSGVPQGNNGVGIDDDGSSYINGTGLFHKGSVAVNGNTSPALFNSSYLGLGIYRPSGTVGMEIGFIGSGLDIVIAPLSNAGATIQFFLDGVSLGTTTPAANDNSQVIAIASGLPFGSHVLQIQEATNTGIDYVTLLDGVIYQPSLPTLPSGATLLADYNIVANFVANTSTGPKFISQGVVRHHANRDISYSSSVAGTGTVNFNSTTTYNGPAAGFGYQSAAVTGDFFNYVFFGSGFCISHSYTASGSSGSDRFKVDGLNLTTANFASLVSTVSGGTYTVATGAYTFPNAMGVQWCFSGLGFGHHTLAIPSLIGLDAIDVIGGVISYKEGQSGAHNEWTGSQSVYDDRRPAKVAANNRMQYLVLGNKSSHTSNTCQNYVIGSAGVLSPCFGTQMQFRSSGKQAVLRYTPSQNSGAMVSMIVDGFAIPYEDYINGNTGPVERAILLSPGFHNLVMTGYNGSGNNQELVYRESETR